MPILPHPRQERYAQGLAQGLTQAEAHKQAGYSGDYSAASLMLDRNVKIKERVNELLEEKGQKVEVNAAWVLENLKQIAIEAKRDKDRSAANKALELIGKHLRMFVDRQEHTGADGEAIKYDIDTARQRLLDAISQDAQEGDESHLN